MSWQICSLGDVITLKRGHDLPAARRKAGEIPVVSSSGITGFHNKLKAKAPGVVTGRYGTLGKVFYMDRDYWPLNTSLYVVDFKGNNPRFSAYFLKNVLRGYQSDKAAVPGVNRNVLHKLEVQLPGFSVQKTIASILSAYDDLIENNLRRIKLLEESARLLYREWFVNLRFPGHEHTRIVDGVPEGWEKEKVANLILKFRRKKKIKKGDFLNTGSIPCIDQSGNFIGGYTEDKDALHSSPLPLIVFGDHTRILKFIDFPFASGADGTQLIYPNSENFTPHYFYFALKEIDLSNYFYARHFKFLKDQIILIPSETLIGEFTDFAKPIMSQIGSLRIYNQKLKAARDLLLPRLMSGDISV